MRAALVKVANLGIDQVRANLDAFPIWVRKASVDDGDLPASDRNLGIILTLDQGARYLCRGINARYAYDYFQQIPIHTIRYVTDAGMARLRDWEAAGVDKDQAMVRALVMLGVLARSEDPSDHEHYLRIVEALRKEYERLTHTHDPYRSSSSHDIQDVELYGRILEEGPPQWEGVHMTDVIYWLMRVFVSHIAHIRYFGRSPFRNIAVGRLDTDEEVQWLSKVGVHRTQEDEKTRDAIKQDMEQGIWRPLQL